MDFNVFQSNYFSLLYLTVIEREEVIVVTITTGTGVHTKIHVWTLSLATPCPLHHPQLSLLPAIHLSHRLQAVRLHSLITDLCDSSLFLYRGRSDSSQLHIVSISSTSYHCPFCQRQYTFLISILMSFADLPTYPFSFKTNLTI